MLGSCLLLSIFTFCGGTVMLVIPANAAIASENKYAMKLRYVGGL